MRAHIFQRIFKTVALPAVFITALRYGHARRMRRNAGRVCNHAEKINGIFMSRIILFAEFPAKESGVFDKNFFAYNKPLKIDCEDISSICGPFTIINANFEKGLSELFQPAVVAYKIHEGGRAQIFAAY